MELVVILPTVVLEVLLMVTKVIAVMVVVEWSIKLKIFNKIQ